MRSGTQPYLFFSVERFTGKETGRDRPAGYLAAGYSLVISDGSTASTHCLLGAPGRTHHDIESIGAVLMHATIDCWVPLQTCCVITRGQAAPE